MVYYMYKQYYKPDRKEAYQMELSKEAVEARRAYQRAYYHNHKDKIKAAQERYWLKKAEKMAAEKEATEAAQNDD